MLYCSLLRYGDFYPISDAGLYVNCFVILMDVLFLGYITSVVFDMVVGSIERKEQIRKETGGRDLLSDLSFYEFLYLENTEKRWTSQTERELREHQKKVREYDFSGQKVMVNFSRLRFSTKSINQTTAYSKKHIVYPFFFLFVLR